MSESIVVDARGLTCPLPVLETKKALESNICASHFTVLVDNDASKENVSRFGANNGFQVTVRANGPGGFELVLSRSEMETSPSCDCEAAVELKVSPKNVVYIGSAGMGKGDDELGSKLMRGFLRTWIDSEYKPWRMIFINSGVRLTSVDEESVEAVAILQEKGVEILSCGTCLTHFGLMDKLKVGKVTNMYEVIESLNLASKVITPD